MLGKLIKYELKASGRILLPLDLAVIAIAVISGFFFNMPSVTSNKFGIINLIGILIIVLYAALIFASIMLSFIISIIRYKKNLFDSEGYLMNTLPVFTHQNITAKLICAIIYQILGFVFAALSGLICYLISVKSLIFFSQLWEAIQVVVKDYLGIALLYGFETVILGLAILACINLMLYAAISIGYSFNSRKTLKSVGSFIGLYVISQFINFFLIRVLGSAIDFINITTNSLYLPQPYLIALFLLETIYCVAYFVISNYFLKNRLNLQ